jgi:soluble lytic murein transglycosylase-like protein|tara:strand:- start:214 stop:687 length:474 start_codon:yes stop_codon:yes gene_type:complete
MNGITAAILCASMVSAQMPRAKYACTHTKQVVKECKKHKLDPIVFVSLIHVESNWRPHVVSYANACGLTQVIPKWSRGWTCKQLKKPKTSIKVGSRILGYWLHKYAKGNYYTALCGYNAGFRCKGKNPIKHGKQYAKKVMKMATRIMYHTEEKSEKR